MLYYVKAYQEAGHGRGNPAGYWCDTVEPYVAGCLAGPYASEPEAIGQCLAKLKSKGHTGTAKVLRPETDDKARRFNTRANGKEVKPKAPNRLKPAWNGKHRAPAWGSRSDVNNS